MKFGTSPWVVALAFSLGVAPWAAAEEAKDAAPQRLIVHHNRIDPADLEAYESWFKDWVEAAKQAGLGPEWNWYTSSSARFHYTTVTPFGKFAELDDEEAREKRFAEAVGKAKYDALLAKSHLVRSHWREAVRLQPELSYRPKDEDTTGRRFMNVAVHRVRPGMGERYLELLKKVAAGYARAGHPLGWNAYAVEFGEGSYVFTVMAKSAAEYHTLPQTGAVLAKAYDTETAQSMYKAWRDCISDYQSFDYTLRPDLSYVAAAPKPAGE